MNGCILVHAEPYEAAGPNRSAPPGFVYEGDRRSGAVRLPALVPPVLADGFMATNHYWRYEAVAGHPERCNGGATSFSSLARYWTGANAVEARHVRGGRRVGTRELKALLQAVAHGTTEHSIIFKPHERTVELAVASANGLWDAPYAERWAAFSFDELFEARDGQSYLSSWHSWQGAKAAAAPRFTYDEDDDNDDAADDDDDENEAAIHDGRRHERKLSEFV